MNRILLLSFFILSSFFTQAQSLSLSNQYLFNDYYYNPGAAYGEGVSAMLGYRKQWVGFDGSPSVKYVSLSGQVYNNMALGTVINIEQYHILENFNARLSYAYHVALTEDHLLDFGVEGVYRENRLNTALIDVNDVNDLVLLSGTARKASAIDANFGVKYRFNGLEVGVGAFNLLASDSKIEESGLSSTLSGSRHFIGNLSYHYNITEDELAIKPFALVRMYENSPISFDAGAMVIWRDMLNLGVAYRNNSSVIGSIAARIKNNFLIGYSYDFGFGTGLYDYATSTHEVYAGFSIGAHHKKMEEEKSKLEMESAKLNTRVDSLNSSLDQEKLENKKLKESYEQKIAALEEEKETLKSEKESKAMSTSEIDSPSSTNDNISTEGSSSESGKVEDTEMSKVESSSESGSGEPAMEQLDNLEKGYYIVVKSFLNKDFASKEMSKIKEKGYNPLLVFNKSRGYYYVYLEKFSNLPTALKELENIKASGFKDAWLYLHQ